MNHPIVLGITGASGAIYALRLLDVLRSSGRDVHLSISSSGGDVIRQELKTNIDLYAFDDSFFEEVELAGCPFDRLATSGKSGKLHYFHHQDFMAPMASGSFLTAGMGICPGSGTPWSAVAAGAAGNLIQRAAEVPLKERRKLILVPRE